MKGITILLPNLNRSLWGLISSFVVYSETFKVPLRFDFNEEYIKSRFRGASSFAVIIFNDKEYLVDLQDNPRHYDFYSDYELVFKRSYSSHLTYVDRIIPYGFRIDQTVALSSIISRSNFLSLRNWNKRNLKEIQRSSLINKILIKDLFDNSISNIHSFFSTEIIDYNGRIAYSARFWKEDGREDRIKINRQRELIFNYLSKSGLDCFTSNKFISQKEWIRILNQSNIVIVNNGLHDVPGLRIAEATLFSRCPVTPALNVVIPDYSEGENYLKISDDIADIGLVLENLLKEKTYLGVQKNNLVYSRKYLIGSKKAAYILDEIKKKG